MGNNGLYNQAAIMTSQNPIDAEFHLESPLCPADSVMKLEFNDSYIP